LLYGGSDIDLGRTMMVRFGILGPICVWAGERLIRVGGPRERRLLAMLLLDPNTALPLHRLAAALWDRTRR